MVVLNPCRPAQHCRVARPLPVRPLRCRKAPTGPSIRTQALGVEAVGLGLFFAPGAAALLYALVRGKGNIQDGFSHLITLLSQGYLQPDAGGKDIPVAEGDLSEFTGSYIGFLYSQFLEKGSVFRLSFGPKSFIIISDPAIAKFVLRERPESFDKGVLAEILEPIMGKGLIPADLETWKQRRRAIVPAFHKAYLTAMVNMFSACTQRTIDKFARLTERDGRANVNMEDEFLSLGLDIIGLGVFNYDFGSVTSESPVIKAVYRCLREAEHRSTFYVPYWNIPFADRFVPRLREFRANMAIIDSQLDDLISLAVNSKQEEDIEALQARDYSAVRDPSLLRFLVDMRGEDISGKQLRDDLMTMLIAGHETTAAVLTWSIFCLTQAPEKMARLVAEIDAVVGDRAPTWDDIRAMPYLRNTLAESLRLYPQPPVLIRRAMEDITLPPGFSGNANGFPLAKGCDMFISTWNLHRSPALWKDAERFEPERFDEPYTNPDLPGWAGYNPEAQGSSMYPNEVSSDFAFLPFGGGSRKCVGDQFALLEGAVALAMLLRRFNFELAMKPEDVGLTTGATIHTVNGMYCNVTRRVGGGAGSTSKSEMAAV